MMPEWWNEAVIYHIYPRSFQDSNRDGIGDLNGITSRLGYLQWLGIDAVWISPVYPSPMADFGYDVTDHCDIDPMFGSLEDMDHLLEEAHKRRIKVILDFVPNHTSNRHPWFLESRSGRKNPKRDWYYWKDPGPDGGPPNNWLSRFDGNSAWAWDENTGQYYLHTFLEEQPDLNWRNPEVREAMLNVLRFWFDRGVDGFRVDVSYRVMKDPDFRDNPQNPNWTPGMDPSFRVIEKHTKNTPDIHRFNRWIRQTADEYDNRVLIGEMNLSIEELSKHYGTATQPEFHLPFNFRLIFSEWDAANVKNLVDQFEEHVPNHGWPNWVLSNHDQPRFATRAGAGQARNGHLFLLTARGTPTIYYGDELGMESVEIPHNRVRDPWELLSPGLGLGRDPVRTPMQWSRKPNAGFSDPDVTPWLPLEKEYEKRNTEILKKDSSSILRFIKRVIEIRRRSDALTHGGCSTHEAPDGVLLYTREHKPSGERVMACINITGEKKNVPLKGLVDEVSELTLLLSTEMDDPAAVDTEREILVLRANEGILLTF
ncbi:MAG: alpha-amylase [Bacteroidetes bacterium]|nr:alpha-amylase [Bacteroidota bacterium]